MESLVNDGCSDKVDEEVKRSVVCAGRSMANRRQARRGYAARLERPLAAQRPTVRIVGDVA